MTAKNFDLFSAPSRNWLSDFFWNGCSSDKRETKLNLQATFGAIGSRHSATVKTYGALRDGKTETDPSGLAVTCVVETIEGPEEFIQGVGRNPRAAVRNFYDCFCATGSFRFLKMNLDRGAFAGVANGIAHDIFDGAM
jgi:hypothetical protein